jgi:hypothetical protein
MLIDANLKPTLNPRRQIPAPLLEYLIELSRSGVDSLTIPVLDQLAPLPSQRRRVTPNETAPRIVHMPSIPDAIRSICYLAPPANTDCPILTMAPDSADHGTYPPEQIREQWRQQVNASCDGTPYHSWRGVQFGAVARVDGYRLIGRSPFIIRTASTEPYANLWITVNPASSEVLRSLPAKAPATLIGYLSQAGHGNGVAIIPERFKDLFVCNAPTISADGTVAEIAQAVASLWHPDTYIKHTEAPLQRGFGIHYPAPRPGTLPELGNGWSNKAVQQIVDEQQMQQALHDELVGLIVSADGGGDAVLLMTNGISGHDGGL